MTSAKPREQTSRAGVYPYALGLFTTWIGEPLTGARYLSIATWLRDFDAWRESERQRWQRARFDEVLQHAREHVPFYRRLLGPSADVRNIRLTDLPVVDKARIRADPHAFLSAGWRDMPWVDKATAGTTGDPWRYPLDRHAWAHVYGAHLHLWERIGYRYGERVVSVGTPPSLVPEATKLKARLRARLERRSYSVAGIEVDPQASLRRALGAASARGVLWYGYAGMMAAMADAVSDEGLEIPGPRAIVTTSEPLEPRWRRRIEEVFGAPVFDEYGCNDGGVLALTCERGRFHVAESISIVEVLNGDDPCPPGVEGDVTITNLHARVLPFLRYKVGDRAALGAGTCACGRAGVTLERIIGRSGDRLRLPDGRELSAMPFGPIFWRTPHVHRWQIVQTNLRHVTVRLEVDERFDQSEADFIRQAFRKRCGDEMTIELTTSQPIERTPAGKQKILISALGW